MTAVFRPAIAAIAVTLLPGGPAPAAAQAPAPFQIKDNSFLVEEAFNQEPGVVQNIFAFRRQDGSGWLATFTQEWPVTGERHQFSYTIPFAGVPGACGLADVALNYRLQVLEEEERGLAFSPRLTVILPTGNSAKGLGNGGAGIEVNLPFSRQTGDVYWHWNAGATHIVRGDAPGGGKASFTTWHLAWSAIWRARPMANLMFESLVDSVEAPLAAGVTDRHVAVTLSPGIRGGWNVGESQIILGLAVPVAMTSKGTSAGVLAYFSYEVPLWRVAK
jgi:hypothetical protein